MKLFLFQHSHNFHNFFINHFDYKNDSISRQTITSICDAAKCRRMMIIIHISHDYDKFARNYRNN